MCCCCFLHSGVCGVIVVGRVRDYAYGLDAGVDVGFDDGARSRGYVFWFHNRFAHVSQINRPGVNATWAHLPSVGCSTTDRKGAIAAVPIWSKLYIYPG